MCKDRLVSKSLNPFDVFDNVKNVNISGNCREDYSPTSDVKCILQVICSDILFDLNHLG